MHLYVRSAGYGTAGTIPTATYDARFYRDPETLPAGQVAVQRDNMATLRVLAGDPYMHDPKLLRRLRRVDVPALLLWGESDRIVTPAYGAAYAEAFGRGRLQVISEAGHLPQLEQPEATCAAIDGYLREMTADPRGHALVR
ncbi:alpha/beta fold hydrolase [Streptomyces sp. NBC_00354]|uniref:alpha/beta fold hydrolase n=1 Tax=Streptomyces sp. NBC_00354 TaxID=2975723 RepID=UPI002E263BF1